MSGPCAERPGVARAEHSQFQIVLVSTKRDPPPRTGGRLSRIGGASARTGLRKGEKSCTAPVVERNKKIETNSPADTKVDEGGRVITGYMIQ